MRKLFFIVGVGRSGTSLLHSILSSHSKISMPPETGFLRNVVLSFKKYSNLSLDDAIVLNPKLKRIQRYIGHTKTDLYNDEIELYNNILEEYRRKQNKIITGDKDPRLVEYIQSVSDLYKSVKFIHLVRDPRDVLLSKKNAEWSKDRPSFYHIFANYVQLKLGEYQGDRLSKNAYHLVTYEDLLNAPEAVLRGICTFLSVEYEDSILSFQGKAEELVAEDEKQWKKETMGPLLTNNTGKWVGELKQWEIALIERIGNQAFKIGGYEKINAKQELSFIGITIIIILSVIIKVSGKLYMIYRFFYQDILIRWKF